MRKKTAYILPFLLLLIGQSAESQIQNNIPDYIRQRFHMYMETVPWEEIYVHSDRNEYISGEDLWFDVYLIDRQSLKPSANSRIAYIELLNARSRPVLQKRILLVKGFGPGQIRLPDTLSTGTYTIRAYTNWMKNFLPWNCFRKEIKIFNSLNTGNSTLKPPALEAATRSIDTQPRSGPINTDITLVLNNSDSNTLILSVSAGENYLTANGNHFTLVVQTRGNIDLIDSEVLAEGKARITIPRISLISGINQITILDSRLKPVCERYVFNPPGYRPAFNLLSPAAANKREKISLEFDLRDIPALAVNPANLSISVAAASNTNAAGLDDYLLFGTEFGFIPPDVLNSGGQRGFDVKIIDSIMSDKKSRWIDWDEILSGSLPHFKYQAEKEDHFLSGKLLSGDQSTSVSSEYVLLCMPGKEAVFQYGRTDSEGNFIFSVHIDEEMKDLVLLPDDAVKTHKIIIESSFPVINGEPGAVTDTVSRSVPGYIPEWGVNYQVRKIYGISDAGNLLTPGALPLKPIRFYGKPDIELIMADYITLPEMKEVFLELLPHVSLKKKRSGYEIAISDRIYDSKYELSPAMFLDGVKIQDASMIAGLDPALVEEIDIIKEEYIVGRYSFPGIINVITRTGDFSAVPLPDYMTRFSYRVVEPVRSFISPDYSSEDMKNSTIPDFRNTLYWNPSVRPGKDGKVIAGFWTSDVSGDYVIDLQGVTTDGKIISVRKSFRVD